MAGAFGQFDKVETEDEITQATAVVARVKGELEALGEQTAPLPGSQLDTEDKLTTREPLSTLVRGMRNSSVDALELLLDAMVREDAGELWARPMSPYGPSPRLLPTRRTS